MKTQALWKKATALILAVLMVPLAGAPMAWAATSSAAAPLVAAPFPFATNASSIFASGEGTQANPYVVADASQLAAFRDSVNAGTTYEGEFITLAADINLGGASWTPIGKAQRHGSGLKEGSTPFKGTFDGTGHSIEGLVIDTTTNADAPVGLFGALVDGTVENLKLVDARVDVPTSEIAGIAIGMVTGGATVHGVFTSGAISALCAAGGIVGRMTLEGTISDCTNSATVTTAGGSGNTGGIVGAAYYTTPAGKMVIKGCSNDAVITGINDVGGIVGLNSAFVSDCVNSGAINGSDYALGGIAGECKNYGGIDGCTNSAAITYTGTSTEAYGVGGIVGWVRYDGLASAYAASAAVPITNNVNSGAVKGSSDAGGIVGTLYNAGTVTGNQNTAPSLASSDFGAGIVANIQNFEKTAVDVGSTMTVQNNVSTTPLSAIQAGDKSEFAYNNIGTAATVANNAAQWKAQNGTARYVDVTQALSEAQNGDTVSLVNDLTQEGTIEKTGANTVTLDLAGHSLQFAPGNCFLVTGGTFVVTGRGSVAVANDATAGSSAPSIFVVKPARQADPAPQVQVTGGSYNADVSAYVPSSFAELVKDQTSQSGKFVVMPENQAKQQARAQVTVGGKTVYYMNAKEAERASSADPSAELKIYDTRKPVPTTPAVQNDTSTPSRADTPRPVPVPEAVPMAPAQTNTNTNSNAGTLPSTGELVLDIGICLIALVAVIAATVALYARRKLHE